MDVQIAATEARATLPSLLDRVESGARITLTRHGKPVAVLVHPDSVRPIVPTDLGLRVEALGAVMAAATHPGESPVELLVEDGVSPDRADELVAMLRADRDMS